MPDRSNRYGLNLDRSLYFEGRLTTAQASALGAFTLASFVDCPDKPPYGKLNGLTGDIFGIASTTPKSLDTRRRLTKAPVSGVLSINDVYSYRADITDGLAPKTNTLYIEAGSYLHIPYLEIFKKYDALVPHAEYLTGTWDNLDDHLSVKLSGNSGLMFSVNIGYPES